MTSNALYFLGGLMLAGLLGIGVWMIEEGQRGRVEISVLGHNGIAIERR